MAREDRNVFGFTVALISEFAQHYGVHPRQAYAYLKRFKGMDHLRDHYAVLHTQSFWKTSRNIPTGKRSVIWHSGGRSFPIRQPISRRFPVWVLLP